MTEAIIKSITEHHKFTSKEEYLSYKKIYNKFTDDIRQQKNQYKCAQRNKKWSEAHILMGSLQKARTVFIYYMLITKSDKKLIKAFALNPTILKQELLSIEIRIDRAIMTQTALNALHKLPTIEFITDLNILEFLSEKISRINSVLECKTV